MLGGISSIGGSRGHMRQAFTAVGIAVAFGACNDERAGVSGLTDADADADRELVILDQDGIGGHDVGRDLDASDDRDGPGAFGAACAGNEDCDSGWCVESTSGYVCTKECLEACPDGFDCRSVQNGGGDITFLCVPRVQRLCVPCLEDFQCNGGACLAIDGTDQCASPCAPDDDDACPDGFVCAEHPDRGPGLTFCQPRSGSCSCTAAFAGSRRACQRDNAVGTCFGVETCDPARGWVDCSAREPTAETCDYVDDDCDGDVDEDFKTDGVYASVDGCGSCDTRCEAVLANAIETECAVEDGSARCKVVACAGGFNLVNPYVCAPAVGDFCKPCASAAECLGTAAACTALDDGTYCTRGCVHDNNCPAGYACRDTANDGRQCLPISGSCTCDASSTDLARACSKVVTPADPNAPVVTCKGFEQCTADGWGPCEVPVDICDGIDNDCDGVVDGPYTTDGRYSAVEHCGACDISCVVLTRPNARPVCDLSGALPTCGIACVDGAVDVDGVLDNGCECVPVPGDDLAGDDLDSDCDGVDGEVAEAVFVSKDGDDDAPGTRDEPVATIRVGLLRATERGLRDVYVATGVYSENVVLADGVGLFGGYSPDFATHDVLLYETPIIGVPVAADDPSGAIGTVTAIGVGNGAAADGDTTAAGTAAEGDTTADGTAAEGDTTARDTVLDGFTIFGINAANTVGGTSYGVYVRDGGARLRISHNRVYGGAGGNGAPGVRGVDGLPGGDGAIGYSARNLPIDCLAEYDSPGGPPGARVCPDGTDVGGGRGGRAFCPVFEVTPDDLAEGQDGKGPQPGVGGGYGWPLQICANDQNQGCSTFSCTTCRLPLGGKRFNPINGSPGKAGAAGNPGAAGTASGRIADGLWSGEAGGDGNNGKHGSGGGGGGAAGGVQVVGEECDYVGNDDVGGSGGGGAAGGCFGTGGSGGGGGGGSFGIFLVGGVAGSYPTIVDNTLEPGRGGDGGGGGAGGVGGAGGHGARGGLAGDSLVGDARTATRCAFGGGDGADGGMGGHGGGGGGGAGGASFALFAQVEGNEPAAWKTGNRFVLGGGAGRGGAGGVSLEATRSGANGADGRSGTTNF